jgi:hypothetical protein
MLGAAFSPTTLKAYLLTRLQSDEDTLDIATRTSECVTRKVEGGIRGNLCLTVFRSTLMNGEPTTPRWITKARV